MPWALHVEILNAAFRERAEAVRAEFLEGIEISGQFCDCYDLTVNLHAQRFFLAQTLRFGNRNDNRIRSFILTKLHRQMQRVFWCWSSPFVSADAGALIINETAAEITRHRQQRDANQR